MRLQEQIGEADDGGQHVVEVVRHAARQLPDGLHLVAVGEFELQLLLLGGVDNIEDRALARPGAGAERAHVDAARELALGAQEYLHGARPRAARAGPLQGPHQLLAAALVRARRQVVHGLRQPVVAQEHAHERGVGIEYAAVGGDGGDAERRRLHGAGELRLSGCPRFLLRALAAVEDQDREHAARPMPAAYQVHRKGAAVLAQQIEVEPRDPPGPTGGPDQRRAVG